MNKNRKTKIALYLSVLGIFIIILTLVIAPDKSSETSKNKNSVLDYRAPVHATTPSIDKFQYLSDIPYIKEQSNTAWKTIEIDKTVDGNKITVRVENGVYEFDKGIWAHATSTIVYDISSYNYDYFTAYIGLNTTSTKGNGVKFTISTSSDGINWDNKTTIEKLPNSNASFIKVDIKNAKYLKLYAHDNGGNGQDHSVYADAKLIKENYDDNAVHTVEYYDQILKTTYANADLSNSKYELTLLQREFVNNVGRFAIKTFVNESEENKKVFEWLFNDLENLRLYTLGGKPTGSYINSLNVLSKLYNTYKDDFTITEVSKYGTVIGKLYKKMAITLSLTHSSQVALWMQPSAPENQSDAVTRYAIFKKMYSEGMFVVTPSIDITKWFESYTVEEMRFVLNNIIDDESIIWLNEYTQKYIDTYPNKAWTYLTPHPYMAYVWPNYSNPIFHDPEKKDYWDEKFDGIFSKYGITYSTSTNKVYKVWMNFRNEYGTGAVCGGISKTGSNIRTSHGIPAAVIGQPGHAAIIYYTKNSEGKGYWSIDNDVSGWTLSEKSERMLMGWGNDKRYVRGYNVPYIVMAQEALNRFDEYQKSAELIMVSNLYGSDNKKKESYLRKSLEELDFNIDAWYNLIELYKNDSSKTEEDFYNLAQEMSEHLVEFPLPYFNLMAQIEPKLNSNIYKFKYTLLLTDTLTKGKNYNGNKVLQPGITKTLAAYLLGQTDTSLASFSFDGENAEKIVLSNRFDNNGIRWDYSLDGKKTWKEVSFTAEEEHKLKLTKEEIESITSENDIYIHIVGTNYSEDNLYKIDILEQELPNTIYNNDLENKVIGITEKMEWRMAGSDVWTSFKDKEPDLNGNKTVYVRVAKNGVYLISPELELNYTKNTEDPTRKYVPISHLSIESVSSEATAQKRFATNAIDGNYNTNWHSAWNGSDTERFITIKLDKPMYISAVEFVPAGGGNGKIYDGTIWGSSDGENWEILSQQKGLTYTNKADTIEQAIANTKSFEIENTKGVQYIKIVADRTNGNWFTARAFNLYEDSTIKIPEPTPSKNPTPSISPSPSTTPTPSVNPTPSTSPNPSTTPTPSVNPTPSTSPSPSTTPTPSVNPTPSISPSPSTTPTPSVNPTPSTSPNPSTTPTPSINPTPSISPSPSTTPTPSVNPTPSTSQNQNKPISTNNNSDKINSDINKNENNNNNNNKYTKTTNKSINYNYIIFALILIVGIIIIIL